MSDRPKIRWIEIDGVRTLQNFRLELTPLTVLIGDNGSGKSSVLQALEILRSATTAAFASDLRRVHGWPRLASRPGQDLRLSCGIERGSKKRVRYSLVVDEQGLVREEHLAQDPYDGHAEPLKVISRRQGVTKIYEKNKLLPIELESDQPALSLAWRHDDQDVYQALRDTRVALGGIDVHVSFDTVAEWVTRQAGRRPGPRASAPAQREARLTRLADNLPNIYFALRNDNGEEHWRTTMAYVRLGLGERVESINTDIDVAGGALGLKMKLIGRDQQVPASMLSDGELTYLSFVALARAGEGRTLLAFDEPETHLHPALIARVVSLFDEMSDDYPVILATHSDRILDLLPDPAASTRVLDINPSTGATTSSHLDPTKLDAWLGRYRALSDLRNEGLLPEITA